MKLLTLVIPSYNAEAFLRRCVERMTPAGPEVDILIVDDGSTDGTPAIADALAAEHPENVRVIHQENGGHGEGLNQGIRCAEGIYLKSVDADDRIDTESLKTMVALLREHAEPGTWADLVVNDYVYDHTDRENVFQVRYNHVFHKNRVDTWETCRRFPIWKQFMIHSLCYRVALLREHGYELPKHNRTGEPERQPEEHSAADGSEHADGDENDLHLEMGRDQPAAAEPARIHGLLPQRADSGRDGASRIRQQ